MSAPPAPVVLLTDFGLSDPYVGQMKGSLLSHAPEARIVDLSHQVEPYNILQAGFYLAASRAHFPPGTVFIAVVDPGVGGDRRIVLLEKFGQRFLAPDNGLLGLTAASGGPGILRDVSPPWRGQSSATFHGRDLFAPLAARLVRGESPHALGEEVNPHSLVRLPGCEPVRTPERVRATVLHVDHFGNCILNLDIPGWQASLAKARHLSMTSGQTSGLRPAVTYSSLEPGEVGIIAGSQGYLELAMNQDSAAARLGLTPGNTLDILLEKR
jgi:S-adenosylmethionine hydrolase